MRLHKDAEYMSANRIPHQADRPEASIYVLVFSQAELAARLL